MPVQAPCSVARLHRCCMLARFDLASLQHDLSILHESCFAHLVSYFVSVQPPSLVLSRSQVQRERYADPIHVQRKRASELTVKGTWLVARTLPTRTFESCVRVTRKEAQLDSVLPDVLGDVSAQSEFVKLGLWSDFVSVDGGAETALRADSQLVEATFGVFGGVVEFVYEQLFVFQSGEFRADETEDDEFVFGEVGESGKVFSGALIFPFEEEGVHVELVE